MYSFNSFHSTSSSVAQSAEDNVSTTPNALVLVAIDDERDSLGVFSTLTHRQTETERQSPAVSAN